MRDNRPTLSAACFLVIAVSAWAQKPEELPGDTANSWSPIGINLAEVVDSGGAFPFVDIFKTARPWISQSTGSTRAWDTGEVIRATTEGWPLPNEGQAAATLLCRGIGGRYRSGLYLVLWDGDGDVDLGLDARPVSRQKGRIVTRVTPTNAGILLRVTRSNPKDPVREIKVIMPGYWNKWQKTLFHPVFLERLKPFSALRFGDWQRIDGSPLQTWEHRTTPTTYSQATPNGVALEYMVSLCNRLNCRPWFCIPHGADDRFVREFAKLVKERLEPELSIHLELSNQVWNTTQGQHVHARRQGLQAGLSADAFEAALLYHSQRSLEVFAIWEDVFEGSERLVRILASEAADPTTAARLLDHQQAREQVDALAIAPYFGHSDALKAATSKLGAKDTRKVIELCRGELDEVGQILAANKAVADSRGVLMVAYAGGQHLVADPDSPRRSELTELFTETNRDPRMYRLYRDYFEKWFDGGGGLFVAYSFCEESGPDGAWGALENQLQPPSWAPKYRALRDEIYSRSPVVAFGKGQHGVVGGARGIPRPGEKPFILVMEGGDPLTLCFLLAGIHPTQGFMGPLPTDLEPHGLPGCVLYSSGEILLPFYTDSEGKATVSVTIPLSFVGGTIYVQWAATRKGKNRIGGSTSNCLRVRIQP